MTGPISHPSEHGFSVGVAHPRHSCGTFATIRTADKIGGPVTFISCVRCGITWNSYDGQVVRR